MYSASRTGFLSTWSTERSYLQPHVHIYMWPCGVQWPAVLYTLTAQIQLILRGHMWCPPLSLLRGNLTPPQGAPPHQYSQFALGKRRLLYKSTKSIILLNSNLKDTGYQIMAFVNIFKCAMWKRKLLRWDICPTVFKLGTIVRQIWRHRSN